MAWGLSYVVSSPGPVGLAGLLRVPLLALFVNFKIAVRHHTLFVHVSICISQGGSIRFLHHHCLWSALIRYRVFDSSSRLPADSLNCLLQSETGILLSSRV